MKVLRLLCVAALATFFSSCQGSTTDTHPSYSADTPTTPREETSAERDGLSPRVDVPTDSTGMAPDSVM